MNRFKSVLQGVKARFDVEGFPREGDIWWSIVAYVKEIERRSPLGITKKRDLEIHAEIKPMIIELACKRYAELINEEKVRDRAFKVIAEECIKNGQYPIKPNVRTLQGQVRVIMRGCHYILEDILENKTLLSMFLRRHSYLPKELMPKNESDVTYKSDGDYDNNYWGDYQMKRRISDTGILTKDTPEQKNDFTFHSRISRHRVMK